MRFSEKLYRRRFTPRSRHNYYRKCRPSVLIMRIDAKQACYLRKPRPHRRNSG